MELLITIILPTFNSKEYVSDTINSVLSQTYKKFELLIIDDYSEDGTIDFIKKTYSDKRIKIIDKKTPKGVSYSRCLGYLNSSGEYISFLDSDDLWLPNKLEEQLNFMLINNYKFSCTSIIRKNRNKEKIFKPPREINKHSIQKTNPIHTSSVLVSKKAINSSDFIHMGYDDYILWINIINKGYHCYNLDKNLCIYLFNKRATLSSNYLRSFFWNVNIQLKIIKPNFLSFFYNICSYVINALVKRL